PAEGIIEGADFVPALFEGEAATEHLHSQVVLLIDHQADGFARADADSPGSMRLSMLPADELALDEKLPVKRFEVFEIEIEQVVAERDFADGLAEQVFDFRATPVIGAWRKAEAVEI